VCRTRPRVSCRPFSLFLLASGFLTFAGFGCSEPAEENATATPSGPVAPVAAPLPGEAPAANPSAPIQNTAPVSAAPVSNTPAMPGVTIGNAPATPAPAIATNVGTGAPSGPAVTTSSTPAGRYENYNNPVNTTTRKPGDPK
jgi:hypothetical protein